MKVKKLKKTDPGYSEEVEIFKIEEDRGHKTRVQLVTLDKIKSRIDRYQKSKKASGKRWDSLIAHWKQIKAKIVKE